MLRPIWIFGNAVQDITVRVDLDMLIREYGDITDKIDLGDTPLVKKGVWFTTKQGSKQFSVQMHLEEHQTNDDGMYALRPGDKYRLKGKVIEGLLPAETPSLFLPCEDIYWGGGALNACRFIRSLAPNPKSVPLYYTDIAMSSSLHVVATRLRNELSKHLNKPDLTLAQLSNEILNLVKNDPGSAERLAAALAKIAAEYAPAESLEVYLASLPAEPTLYRPEKPEFRRNWVFSSFRSANRYIGNKIICKGTFNPIADRHEEVHSLLKTREITPGAMLLNSINDSSIFHSAYKLYRDALNGNPDVVGIMAMTGTTQKHIPWLLSEARGGTFPPFITVLNEQEAADLGEKLGYAEGPFMKPPDGLPNMKRFALLLQTILKHFVVGQVPRIYVTLGPRGSLGFDGSTNMIIYVSCFSRPGEQLFDTNACGDAFCAGVTLLEWAKRHVAPNIVDAGDGPQRSAEEMMRFMAVATATAHCKATERRGRVDAKEVEDILEHTHVACGMVGTLRDLEKGEAASWVDKDGDLRLQPPEAKRIRVSRVLLDLFKG